LIVTGVQTCALPICLPVPAPYVAPELGHHRQREGRVADHDDEQGARAGSVPDELEPDEEDEPGDRRPPPERGRIVRDRPGGDAEIGRASCRERGWAA